MHDQILRLTPNEPTERTFTQHHGHGPSLQPTGSPHSHRDPGRDHTPGQGQRDLKVHQGEREGLVGGARMERNRQCNGGRWGLFILGGFIN